MVRASRGSPQVLRLEVLLTKRAAPPEEVARELAGRLNALPYVLGATWSSDVIEDDGDQYLRGVVSMLTMAELPEEDPDLKTYYDCFAIPGIIGPEGPRPATVAQQTTFVVEEFDRLDQDKRLRTALGRHAVDLQRDLLRADLQLPTGIEIDPPLGPVELELAVAINALWEDIDRASHHSVGKSDPDGPGFEFDQGHAAGLRAAGLHILNELTRRRLPFVASAASDMLDPDALE